MSQNTNDTYFVTELEENGSQKQQQTQQQTENQIQIQNTAHTQNIQNRGHGDGDSSDGYSNSRDSFGRSSDVRHARKVRARNERAAHALETDRKYVALLKSNAKAALKTIAEVVNKSASSAASALDITKI